MSATRSPLPTIYATLLLLLAQLVFADTIGPFQPKPAATVYLVAGDEPVEATITVTSGTNDRPRWFLLRAFDPAEDLALWRYVEYVDEETIASVPAPDGIELRPAADAPADGDTMFETQLTLDRPGVYQIRLSTDWQPAHLTIDTDAPIPWGVCFQNGEATSWSPDLETLHLFIPPHAEQLQLLKGPVAVTDDTGSTIATLDAESTSATLPIDRTSVVWKLDFPRPGNWKLAAADLPFILCPTPEAARAIHGSVDTLDDGTVICHAFQREIAALLPSLLARVNVGDTAELTTPLSTRRDAWLADPVRNSLLIGGFLATIEKTLSTQNLDPASHWSGSLDGWQDRQAADPPENRWDRLWGIEGLYAGASSHYNSAALHLAEAALYDDPVNPYFGRRELLYRAAAAALRDLMALAEDETWPGTSDLNPYPGNMAFCLGQKTLPVYGVAAPEMPTEIRDLWTDAVRRIIDRSFCDELVTCRNQSSHYLVAFQAFADGAADPRYDALIKLYSRRWVRGQHSTGYHMECCGPDASYIGMTHWHEAVYYRMSQDPLVLESIQRSYRFFNHTVAPEPDGRMLGGFNFNHRIGEGFYLEQWSGARGILDDVLPEVGIWAAFEHADRHTDESRQRAVDAIERFLADPKHPLYSGITSPRYWHLAEPDVSVPFPCMESEPFIRTLGDEIVAIRRPAYYVTCYTGKPAAEFYIRNREKHRDALPDDAESTGGYLPSARDITPFVGGGLSGFWTPQYGHGLMAGNWATTTHHGITATKPDGKRYWEDYHAHTSELDVDAATLTFRGKIEAFPISYARAYTFADDHVRVDIELTAEEPVQAAALIENIPLARGQWKARGANISAAGVSEGPVQSDAFTITDDTGAGMRVAFDAPQELNLVPNGLQTSGWRKLQLGRVEISLPAELAAGQTVALSYRIEPIAP